MTITASDSDKQLTPLPINRHTHTHTHTEIQTYTHAYTCVKQTGDDNGCITLHYLHNITAGYIYLLYVCITGSWRYNNWGEQPAKRVTGLCSLVWITRCFKNYHCAFWVTWTSWFCNVSLETRRGHAASEAVCQLELDPFLGEWICTLE